jgi:hypothetical protein
MRILNLADIKEINLDDMSELTKEIIAELYNYENIIHNYLDNIINIPSIYNIEIEFSTILAKIKEKLLYSLGQNLSLVDERKLIKYYKQFYKTKGIDLKTNKRYSRTIIFSCGELNYSRYILRPKTDKDKEILKNTEGKLTIVPKDEALKIACLPFKMTPLAMLDIAEWGTSQPSYKAAAEAIQKAMKLNLSHELIRQVTEHIGEIIFNIDVNKAEETCLKLSKGDLNFPDHKEDDTVYVQVDGSMLHTRINDEMPAWRENKLGIVFSSDNMEPKEIIHGEMHYIIKKREYCCYLGSVELFQKLLFNIAIKNGYGKYKQTVLISDGATWIRNMKDMLFPDAQQILDFWHLCEHIYDFGKVYFDNDEIKYRKWGEKIKELFLNGYYEKACYEIITMEDKLNKKTKVQVNTLTEDNGAHKLSNYIKNNYNNINYKEYRRQKLYIGSGLVESGNKSVAQERLKRPGMTWSLDNAQSLLTLRAKYKSNLWGKEVRIPILKYYNAI